jgi:hypothetical protein
MSRTTALAALTLATSLGLTPAAGQSIALESIAQGLGDPLYVTHAGDGSGRLFIAVQTGEIFIFDGSQLLPVPFLDITPVTFPELGLLGLAFHPDYATNGYFYVYYVDLGRNTQVARYSVSGNPNVADPGSALLILNIGHPPAASHFGGQLEFGPDGYLYIGTGDAGVPSNGQSVDTLLGKVLRIDVDSGSPYAIPPTNPYVGIPGRDEIWATGLRQAWRFSFDRLNGDLYIGDVGEHAVEEIDFQPAASTGCENYGWARMEGSICFEPPTNCSPGLPTGCNPSGELTLPILEYTHTNNPCDSVTGGYLYRGTRMPSLYGQYLYADYCNGMIWAGENENGGAEWTSRLLIDTPYNLASFGQDAEGELYVVDWRDGGLYRLTEPGIQLSVDGGCPGTVTVSVSNAPPNTEVGIIAAANNNGFTKGGELCRGVRFTIGEPFSLPPRWIRVDANGNGSASITLPANRCWMQGLAITTCELTNTVQVP